MTEQQKEFKKEWSKKKRIAMEIASEIHDIVEDTIWTDYKKMPELSEKLISAVEDAQAYKIEKGL